MVETPKIHDIKERFNNGHTISQIARDLQMDRKTVRKYVNMEDFSPKVPIKHHRASLLDAHRDFIDEILAADQYVRPKQRHNARRIYERLTDERGFQGSYNLVQRYVKAWREQMTAAGKLAENDGFMPLNWPPGTAQADFGEADFHLNGELQALKFFVLSFPYSNVGFVQVFGGETAECVGQGLKDVANYIGGVPEKIIFDNAAGVGSKIMGVVRETDLFHNFRLHYGFDLRICNPYAGHEKGNTERMVHTMRSKLFVPVPVITDCNLETYNAQLLEDVKKWNDRTHYAKEVNQLKLFEEDCRRLRPLPHSEFEVRRYVERKTDKYGCITVDGKHTYSVNPNLQRVRVIAGIGAHNITVHTEEGTLLAVHPRVFGSRKTRFHDPEALLPILQRNPGSWEQCPIRPAVDAVLRHYIDIRQGAERREAVAILVKVTEQYGFDIARKAFSTGIQRGVAAADDICVLAARIQSGGLAAVPDPGPSLAVYDTLLCDNLKEE